MTEYAAIFRGTGFPLRRSPQALAALRQLEQTRGIRLPPAFVELWGCEGVVEFFHRNTNADHPIAPGKLSHATEARWPHYDPFADGYVPFMVENQGVATWAVGLGRGDDPPVFVEVDSGARPLWQLHAESFTSWVRCVISDAPVTAGVWWQAQAAELTPRDVARLEHQFARGPATYAWPGAENLRFSNSTGRMLLWSGRGQTDWMISPAPGQERALLASIIDLSDLRDSLYPMTEDARRALGEHLPDRVR